MPPKLIIKQSILAPPASPPHIGVFTPAPISPRLIWVYGPSGSGKTYFHRTHFPAAFIKSADCNWFGYKSEEVVVIEDFDLTARKVFQLQFNQWLTTDYLSVYVKRYKKKAISPKIFVVTSYYHPLEFRHLKPFIMTFLSNCTILRQTRAPPPLVNKHSRIVVTASEFEPDSSLSSSSSSDEEEPLMSPCDVDDDDDYPLTQPDPPSDRFLKMYSPKSDE